MSTPCYYCELSRATACTVCIHGEADADEIRALAKDADRYRWLRGDGCNVVWMAIDTGECLGALDATIDAAMQKRA